MPSSLRREVLGHQSQGLAFRGILVNQYGYGSIPIDTFLVGWTSIYQLFWGSLGTRVLTHPHMRIWCQDMCSPNFGTTKNRENTWCSAAQIVGIRGLKVSTWLNMSNWGFHASPITTILQEHIEACEKPKEYKVPRKKVHLSAWKRTAAHLHLPELGRCVAILSFFQILNHSQCKSM